MSAFNKNLGKSQREISQNGSDIDKIVLCFEGCDIVNNFVFAFLSGTKPVTWNRRVHVKSKAKNCWNKTSWIISARVNLKTEIGHVFQSSGSVISQFVARELGKN